jgi:pimeloyl-ACP methyl ester carboxylesterase
MRFSTSIPTLVIALMASILVTACGESDPALPTATATVSGVVRAATGAVIEGASVSIGSASTTTGADGRFELHDLPVGNATIITSAPRFDQRWESVTLNAGTNAHDVVLPLQTIFKHQDVLAYLPPGKDEYRAAIVFLPGLRDPATGNPLDSRRLVSGASGTGCSIWCAPSELEEVKRRSLELASGNVVLVGTTTLLDQAADYAKLLQALSQVAAQSLHPELASIPILFVGHSQGGCTAYGFSRDHAARVAGFVTMKGGCHNPGPAEAASTVPGFFLIGRFDEPHRTANITPVFEAGRAAGAPWTLSIDAFGHGPIVDFALLFDWIDAVLTARLPATAGAPLRAMTETGGWLGDRSTGAISTYACYGGTRSSASWLPSREAALGWQRMAGGTVVVSTC